MNKKKGLSRQFIRDVRVDEELVPSEYEIVPQKLPRIDLDDPTEIVRRHKEFLKTQEKRVIKFPKSPQPFKAVEEVKPETPSKDKIKLIANKLNFLRRNKQEREKTDLVEKKEPGVKKETEEGKFSSKFKPVSLSPKPEKQKSEPVSKEKPESKKQEIQSKLDDEDNESV